MQMSGKKRRESAGLPSGLTPGEDSAVGIEMKDCFLYTFKGKPLNDI